MKSLSKWFLPLIVIIIAVIGIRNGNNPPTPYQHDKGFIFGTVYSIKYQCDSNHHKAIREELERVDRSLSVFNEESVISAINSNTSMATDTLFRQVFLMAQDISYETNGAFDITVAPLVNAWGFGFKSDEHPTAKQVEELRMIVGFEKVNLSADSIVKDNPRIMLDCSAIAKGFGCDMVAYMLRSRGIQNFMVEIGGEIVVSGISTTGEPWRVGVSKPVDDSLAIAGTMDGSAAAAESLQTVLNVSDIAMATSGNYRNFYYKDGRKYAHTIDPKTGYPVQHSILSATVLAKTCAVADAYATSFMVMGLDKAKAVLDNHPELKAYIIYSDSTGNNAVWQSEGM